MTTYQLKPLEWKREKDTLTDKYQYVADTIFGEMRVSPELDSSDDSDDLPCKTTGRWKFLIDIDDRNWNSSTHDTKREAQEAAAKWYAERIAPALKAV
jgi:hypothetical protein